MPHLGVVQAGASRFTVADVPGLIPGASQGKGLGLEFLRHVERCAVIVHVLDCATLEPNRDPISDLDVLLAELATYSEDLVSGGEVPMLERPAVVVLNKIDVPEARELAELVRPELEARGLRVFEVSTASHEGLRPLTFALAELVREAREATPPPPPRAVLRPRRGRPGGVHRDPPRGGHPRLLPGARAQAGALGAPDRLRQRRGGRLPRRPAGPARRRGGALRRRRDARAPRW